MQEAERAAIRYRDGIYIYYDYLRGWMGEAEVDVMKGSGDEKESCNAFTDGAFTEYDGQMHDIHNRWAKK